MNGKFKRREVAGVKRIVADRAFLGLIKGLLLGVELGVGLVTRGADGLGIETRARAVDNAFAEGRQSARVGPVGAEVFKGIGEEVELLRLPGKKALGKVGHAGAIAGRRKLLGELQRIGGAIKGFNGENAGGLVVFMVFSGDGMRQPGEKDMGPGDAHQTHDLVKRKYFMPVVERAQHVLAGRVVAVEEPDVGNAEGCQRAAGFDFAELAEGAAGLVAHAVAASVAAGAVDDRDAFVLVERDVGEISADEYVIIRVRDDNKHIGLEAGIGRRQDGARDWVNAKTQRARGRC